ncbi:hypothetical protein [Chryseobacterium sp.]|uniref:hypothetical protein n=1 Tax=Chryseobacterium sp. TaxID=1871047 RepID=UPI00388F0255
MKKIINSIRQPITRKNHDNISIKHEQLLSELGLTVYDWAEDFFSTKNLNKALKYSNVFDNYIGNFTQYNGVGGDITKLSVKNKIKIYCKYKGYEFNPAEHVNVNSDLIIKYDPDTKTSVEYIFIKKYR